MIVGDEDISDSGARITLHITLLFSWEGIFVDFGEGIFFYDGDNMKF